MRLSVITLSFLVTCSSAYSADFFDSVEAIGGASPPPIYKAHYDITVNFDELQNAPATLTFDLPNGVSTTVPLIDFNPRQGYEFYDEETDPPGTPLFWIPEGTPHDEIGYKWSGSNEDFDVLISVHNGIMNAIITNNDFRYGMSKTTSGNYRMYEFDYAFFPPTDELGDISKGLIAIKNESVDNKTSISHLKKFNNVISRYETRSNITTIDALVVWTEEARTEAGGASGDPNDTDDIEALIVTAVDHTNTTFINSEMNTRVINFHTAKYNGFSYSGDFRVDLRNLKNDSTIQNLRTSVGADTVIAIIGNDFNQFEVCGTAYVQTLPQCSAGDPQIGCGTGANFKSFSYSILAEFCTIWDDSFTHEIGHNMGANHVQGQNGTGWDLAVINNGFPDAFAHQNTTSMFYTIMAINNPTTARRLNFSNPNVQINGANSGVTNSRNNARVIDLLTPAMSSYENRPDLIFVNGFE